jgi:hypothetical protein
MNVPFGHRPSGSYGLAGDAAEYTWVLVLAGVRRLLVLVVLVAAHFLVRNLKQLSDNRNMYRYRYNPLSKPVLLLATFETKLYLAEGLGEKPPTEASQYYADRTSRFY